MKRQGSRVRRLVSDVSLRSPRNQQYPCMKGDNMIMRPRYLLACLTLATSLTACSTHFTKPGGTTADFEMDKAQCDYQVSAVSMANMSLVMHHDLMHKCLKARGWRPS